MPHIGIQVHALVRRPQVITARTVVVEPVGVRKRMEIAACGVQRIEQRNIAHAVI